MFFGAVYAKQVRQQIGENAGQWIDLKTTFDYLYEAAKDFSKETRAHTNSQTITTVAAQTYPAEYDLYPDFLEILTKDDSDKYLVKFFDGTNTSWLTWESYSDLLQNNNPAGTPTNFAIVDQSLKARITGSATANGSQTGGESILTDSLTDLSSVVVGDGIVNTTGTYYGVVLAAGTTLKTAMFNLATAGGAYAGWTLGDSYIIQPAPRYKIVLDPAPNTTGWTITVNFYAKPVPVYSDYGTYPFATGYEGALIKYAAWLYKYRDSKPNLADPLYVAYEREMRKGRNVHRKAAGATGFRINYKV